MKKVFNKICFYLYCSIPFVSLVFAGISDGLGYEYSSIKYLIFICIWYLFDIRDDLKEFLKSSGNKSVDNK